MLFIPCFILVKSQKKKKIAARCKARLVRLLRKNAPRGLTELQEKRVGLCFIVEIIQFNLTRRKDGELKKKKEEFGKNRRNLGNAGWAWPTPPFVISPQENQGHSLKRCDYLPEICITEKGFEKIQGSSL